MIHASVLKNWQMSWTVTIPPSYDICIQWARFKKKLGVWVSLALSQGSSTFWVPGPIYIFHIILRAAVVADYKIIMDIIIGAWVAYIASPTSQLILQPFCHFTYVTGHSTTLLLLHLHHRSFYNPSVASPIIQALHILHLANRACIGDEKTVCGELACYSKLKI